MPQTVANASPGRPSNAGSTGAHSFRDAIALNPRGVFIAAGRGEDAGPISVIGSCMPVSADPPMIAFLADRDSAAFEALCRTGGFCLNLLSDDQEKLIRTFASSSSPFNGLEWDQAPSGAPILHDVLCWFDCMITDVRETGDHYLAIALVTSFDRARNALPLLSFQRGYGSFAPGSLSVSRSSGLLDSVEVAELATDGMDLLAQELGVECSVVALVDNHWVAVAAANYSETAWRTRLGDRVPIVPPLGVMFVDNPGNGPSEQEWLAGLGSANANDIEQAIGQLRRARERGWSISLAGPYTKEALDDVVRAYSSPAHTIQDEERLLEAVRAMAPLHEPPDLDPDAHYAVVNLDVPVRAPSGEVLVLLRLMELPPDALGSEVMFWLSMLLETAANVEQRIRDHFDTDDLP